MGHKSALIAVEDSELALLRASCYHRICGKYPPIHDQHQAIASAIRVGDLCLADLEHKPRVDTSSTLPSWLPKWLQGVRSKVEARAPSRLSKFIKEDRGSTWTANKPTCGKAQRLDMIYPG